MRWQLPRALGLALGLAASTTGGTAAHMDAASDRARRIDRWLSEPPTPGTELLLMEAAADPRVEAHWRASLSHRDAAVRGAAARAIRATARQSLLADVEAALAGEADALAASEMADASIELSGRLDTRVLEAVRKWPDPLAPLVARTVARRAPAALPEFLLALAPLEVSVADGTYAEVLAYVWRRDASAGSTTCERLASQGNLTSWRIVTGAHERMQQPLPLPLLAAFVSAPGVSGVEEAIGDYLASALGPRGDTKTVASSRARIEALLPAALTPEVRILREVLARIAGDAPSADLGALAGRVGRRSPLSRLRFAIDPVMGPAERAGLDAAWGPGVPQRDESEEEDARRLGFVDDLPAGAWKSLSASSACGHQRSLVSARVHYDLHGRPSRIAPPAGVGEGCLRVLVVLARVSTHLGVGEALVGLPTGVSLPDGFASRPARTPRMASGVGDADLQPPTAKRTVQPTYPFSAIQEQVHGRVWLDVVIDEVGRVRTARVVRSVDRRLDAEALLTMLEWRFGAGRLHGWNVPTRAMVEMEFLLRDDRRR